MDSTTPAQETTTASSAPEVSPRETIAQVLEAKKATGTAESTAGGNAAPTAQPTAEEMQAAALSQIGISPEALAVLRAATDALNEKTKREAALSPAALGALQKIRELGIPEDELAIVKQKGWLDPAEYIGDADKQRQFGARVVQQMHDEAVKLEAVSAESARAKSGILLEDFGQVGRRMAMNEAETFAKAHGLPTDWAERLSVSEYSTFMHNMHETAQKKLAAGGPTVEQQEAQKKNDVLAKQLEAQEKALKH